MYLLYLYDQYNKCQVHNIICISIPLRTPEWMLRGRGRCGGETVEMWTADSTPANTGTVTMSQSSGCSTVHCSLLCFLKEDISIHPLARALREYLFSESPMKWMEGPQACLLLLFLCIVCTLPADYATGKNNTFGIGSIIIRYFYFVKWGHLLPLGCPAPTGNQKMQFGLVLSHLTIPWKIWHGEINDFLPLAP